MGACFKGAFQPVFENEFVWIEASRNSIFDNSHALNNIRALLFRRPRPANDKVSISRTKLLLPSSLRQFLDHVANRRKLHIDTLTTFTNTTNQTMKYTYYIFLFILTLGTLDAAQATNQPSTLATNAPSDPSAVKKWQDDRFGMFIHWGPVSLTGKEISWSRGGKGTPVEVYDNLYKNFNPEKFNADEWVAAAKAAGMKYIVLTAKHHDGFCLWDTKLTDFNIMNSPFKRDVVKELAEACRKQGIKFGCYYSVPDTHNPDYPYDLTGSNHPKREKYDIQSYHKYLLGQTEELIKNYGPLVTIWYDTDGTVSKVYGKNGYEVINLARSLQPDILIDERTGAPGDYSTPEQRVGGFNMTRPWESCMTISAHNHWAWGGEKDGTKPPGNVISMLAQCAGGDGNMLLNVGPRPDGMIAPVQVDAIRQVGEWLKVNGESIYGTRGGPYMPTPRYTSTRKGNVIYLHILKWDGNSCKLPPLGAEIVSSSLLAGGKVDVSNHPQGLAVTLPLTPAATPVSDIGKNAADTVVKLELKGDAMAIQPIKPDPTEQQTAQEKK